MKKLLIFSPSHCIYGGVENIVADLCRELPARGWEAVLGLGKGSRFNDVGKYRAVYPDIPVLEVDGTSGTRQGRLESLRRAIKSYEPDVVLSARIFDLYDAASTLKLKSGRPRLATTVQAYEPQYCVDARLYRSNLDLCVTSGELIRRALVGWAGLPEGRVFSIPGGVAPPLHPAVARSPRKPLRIGYVGRLEQSQKRIFDLPPLLERLDRRGLAYRLDLVGTGPESDRLEERLRPWVERGLATFHGWQSQAALYGKFFPEIDCFVHFAYTEGITIAPREAMANGVVPVVSEFIGLRTEGQFVNEHNALTFPVGDVDAAAANVERLMAEPGLLSRLSTNALNSQVGKYTAAGAMDAWAEAFDYCLEQPPVVGEVPKLSVPADGRLTRLGVPAAAAERIRRMLGRRHVHTDPGSEWPTGSGLLTPKAAAELEHFAVSCERGTAVRGRA